MSDSTKQPSPSETPIYRVPSHGHGKLRVIQPGERANPSGMGGRYHEVTRLCREVGPRATRILIAIMDDESEDTRCRIVAIQEILGRGFGKIPAEVKDGGAPAMNLEAVSEEKLSLVIRALEAAKAVKRAQGEGEGEP